MQSVYFHQIVFTISDFLCALLQETKKLQTYHNWFLADFSSLANYERPRLRIESTGSCKLFRKNNALDYTISWPSFKTKYTIMHDSKGIFRKLLHLSCNYSS